MPEMRRGLRRARRGSGSNQEDVDRGFGAREGGTGQPVMPPGDMFWGDRIAELQRPLGKPWVLAKHVKDLSPTEMKKAQDEFLAKMKK